MFAGSRRGVGVNEERDHTLNQLLTVLLLLFSSSSVFLLLQHCMSHVLAGSRTGIDGDEERDQTLNQLLTVLLLLFLLLLPLEYSVSHLRVGSRRGIGVNEERDQTLNQLLTELDGFEGREGVLLLAATNRAEVSTITHTPSLLQISLQFVVKSRIGCSTN